MPEKYLVVCTLSVLSIRGLINNLNLSPTTIVTDMVWEKPKAETKNAFVRLAYQVRCVCSEGLLNKSLSQKIGLNFLSADKRGCFSISEASSKAKWRQYCDELVLFSVLPNT